MKKKENNKKSHQKTPRNFGQIPRLKVIEFLDIPIGSPKSASCSKYDTIFLRSGLNDGWGLGPNDGVEKRLKGRGSKGKRLCRKVHLKMGEIYGLATWCWLLFDVLMKTISFTRNLGYL